MEVEDDMAPFRNSPFPEAPAILLKPGEPGEEHTRTTLDTIRELTMAARERTLKASLDCLKERC